MQRQDANEPNWHPITEWSQEQMAPIAVGYAADLGGMIAEVKISEDGRSYLLSVRVRISNPDPWGRGQKKLHAPYLWRGRVERSMRIDIRTARALAYQVAIVLAPELATAGERASHGIGRSDRPTTAEPWQESTTIEGSTFTLIPTAELAEARRDCLETWAQTPPPIFWRYEEDGRSTFGVRCHFTFHYLDQLVAAMKRAAGERFARSKALDYVDASLTQLADGVALMEDVRTVWHFVHFVKDGACGEALARWMALPKPIKPTEPKREPEPEPPTEPVPNDPATEREAPAPEPEQLEEAPAPEGAWMPLPKSEPEPEPKPRARRRRRRSSEAN